MNLGKILEALGAAIHQEDDAPPRRRGGGRAKSPIPPADAVKCWQPPQGATPAHRRPPHTPAPATPPETP